MKLYCAAIFFAFASWANVAQSAQFQLKGVDADIVAVELNGEIQPSDFETLKRLIEPRLSTSNSFRWVFLNSPGGDVATAMKIGRYIRWLEFDTTVKANSRCLSSCVFILAAGLNKNVVGTNIVGIHRPFGTSVGSVSREDATRRYREMSAQIYTYFNEMNIPQSLPEEMLRIPPEEMKMLTFDQTVRLGLNGKDPVAQEIDDSAGAKKYGISRQEYLARRNRALNACNLPPPNFFDANCYDAILMGRR